MTNRDSAGSSKIRQRRMSALERRDTIPIELHFPEDCTVGEAEAELFPSGTCVETATPPWFDALLAWPKEIRNILAGGIAGIVAKSVVAPMDRIKILYQVSHQPFSFRSIPSVVRNIVRTEGFTALWKGNTATMIRVFPYSGIQFMVYDRCKQFFRQSHHPASEHAVSSDAATMITPLESLVSGMVAGTISVLCTYPLDLTRAQLAVLKKTPGKGGFVSVLVDNYRHRSWPGLFRGISPTLLGILPYSGFAFALNEQGKREVSTAIECVAASATFLIV